MNKVLFMALMLSILNGCSSMPSEYAQGCQDSVVLVVGGSKESVDSFCEDLDHIHRNNKLLREEGRH